MILTDAGNLSQRLSYGTVGYLRVNENGRRRRLELIRRFLFRSYNTKLGFTKTENTIRDTKHH